MKTLFRAIFTTVRLIWLAMFRYTFLTWLVMITCLIESPTFRSAVKYGPVGVKMTLALFSVYAIMKLIWLLSMAGSTYHVAAKPSRPSH